MAVYQDVSEETMKLFNDVLDTTSISPNEVEFRVLHSDAITGENIYEVKKQTDLQSFLSEGVNIAVVINEDLLDLLEEDQKVILIEEALNGIHVADSGKITIEKPDFNTHTGILQKHGIETMVRLKESVKSLIDEKKRKESEAKAEAKPKKIKKWNK